MRVAIILSVFSMLAAGCGGKVEDTAPAEADPFDAFINVSETAAGDFACFSGGDWLVQTVDVKKQVDFPSASEVWDFEDDCCVGDVAVDVWLGDDTEAQVDLGGTSGADGTIALDLPACTPIAYRTSTDPALDQTKDTYESHQVYAYPDAGEIVATFNSVSTTTYDVVAAVLGVSVDVERSIVAGTAYDCNDEPIQFAQVVVVDDSGTIPDDLVVHYMVEQFPDRSQPHTSADGLWVALNVPAGEWNVELWGVRDGELALLGVTRLRTYANSINVSNIYTGYGDGVKFPDSCVAP